MPQQSVLSPGSVQGLLHPEPHRIGLLRNDRMSLPPAALDTFESNPFPCPFPLHPRLSCFGDRFPLALEKLIRLLIYWNRSDLLGVPGYVCFFHDP